MGKHKRNKSNKKDPMKLSKKRLLTNEYKQYKLIGEPDLSQNWLEIFTPAIVSDLFEIMHNCSNNQTKAKYIQKEMGFYGFKDVNLGTNIYTMSNPAYPGVIFKFALDDNGLADNFNDAILQDLIPRYARTLARHPSGIVSVQERKVVVSDQDRMDTFRSSILKTIQQLSEDFLIVDISPSLYHLNYGIERNGDWCFIDASDLYPLANIKEKLACRKAVGYDDKKRKMKRCGGRLRYNEDFSSIICTKCGAEYLPLEVRPKDKEDKVKMSNAMTDGLSVEEREALRREEMAAILERNGRKVQASSLYGEEDPAPQKSGFVDRGERKLPEPEVEPEDEEEDTDPVEEEDDDEEDDEGEIEVVQVHEPNHEAAVRANTPLEGPPPDIIVIEQDEPGAATKAPHVEFSIDYEDGQPCAIRAIVYGDITEAFSNSSVPFFVGLASTGVEARVMSAAAMSNILIPAAMDLQEEE